MSDDLTKKYYKIGEVSALLGVTPSTLRYWEQCFPRLNPKRNAGGTRKYTPADIEQLRRIQYLIREKGLRVEAAQDEVAHNRRGISKRYEVIQRLRDMRRLLLDIRGAL